MTLDSHDFPSCCSWCSPCCRRCAFSCFDLGRIKKCCFGFGRFQCPNISPCATPFSAYFCKCWSDPLAPQKESPRVWAATTPAILQALPKWNFVLRLPAYAASSQYTLAKAPASSLSYSCQFTGLGCLLSFILRSNAFFPLSHPEILLTSDYFALADSPWHRVRIDSGLRSSWWRNDPVLHRSRARTSACSSNASWAKPWATLWCRESSNDCISWCFARVLDRDSNRIPVFFRCVIVQSDCIDSGIYRWIFWLGSFAVGYHLDKLYLDSLDLFSGRRGPCVLLRSRSLDSIPYYLAKWHSKICHVCLSWWSPCRYDSLWTSSTLLADQSSVATRGRWTSFSCWAHA